MARHEAVPALAPHHRHSSPHDRVDRSISFSAAIELSSPTLAFGIKVAKHAFSSLQIPTCLSPTTPFSPTTPVEEETDILGQLSIRVVGISCVPPPAEGLKNSDSKYGLTAEDKVPSQEEMKRTPSEEKAPVENSEEKRPRRFSIQENEKGSQPFSVFEKGSFHLDSLVELGVMHEEEADM